MNNRPASAPKTLAGWAAEQAKQRLLPLLEEKNLPVILTTHSPSVIQLLEERNYKIEEL